MPTTPLIALLTDFGTADGYVGVMKAVILGIAPPVPLVDITHEIAPQDVRDAAWVLHTAWRYFPEYSIFLCVVDPGVGSARRALAVQVAHRIFVGPDNGLFSYVLDAESVESAVALDNPRFHLPSPSSTFHGRDIFAPCAAHLASGVYLDELGSPVPPESLVTFALPKPAWHGDTLGAHIVHIDHYGNLITDIGADLAQSAVETQATSLQVGAHPVTARTRTFAEGADGEPFFFLDSSGYLAIAVRNGSATAALGVGRDAEVHVRKVT
jgi:S-adenosyl-L-methionine hydrolase (adenosine-forming)